MNSHALVINESPMLLRFVTSVLRTRWPGLQVSVARRGSEGLLQACRERPGLVLIDYAPPDMTGDELCRRLASHPATAGCQVIAMCGPGVDPRAIESIHPNVSCGIAKPFTPDLLTSVVRDVLGPTILKLGTVPNGSGKPVSPPTATIRYTAAALGAAPDGVAAEGGGGPLNAPPLPSSPPAVGAGGLLPHSVRITTLASLRRSLVAQSRPPTAGPRPVDPSAGPLFSGGPGPGAGTIHGRIAFRGNTANFSLRAALHAAKDDRLTGVLRVAAAEEGRGYPTEVFVLAGGVTLVSTREVETYAHGADESLPTTVLPMLLTECWQEQRVTSCPLFLALHRRGVLSGEEAAQLALRFGQRHFSRLWTRSRHVFEFEQLVSLPPFAGLVGSPLVPGESVDDWLLGTLRCLQPHDPADRNPEGYDGVPAYTREGYDRIRSLRLTRTEVAFARQVNGRLRLRQLAAGLGLDLPQAFLLLFRFCCLEVMEYWPAWAVSHRGEPGPGPDEAGGG